MKLLYNYGLSLKTSSVSTLYDRQYQSMSSLASRPIKRLVVLFTGSFNPVTVAHLRLLELARDYYHARSIQVLEGL